MINNFKFDVGFYKTNFNKQKPGGKNWSQNVIQHLDLLLQLKTGYPFCFDLNHAAVRAQTKTNS